MRSMLPLVALLIVVSGCTTSPDWIERTLVTVDVTGTWEASGPTGFAYLLNLEQHGATVKGSIQQRGSSSILASGQVAGTIAGDVFTFRQTNGPVTGELTVSGDEMKGEILQPSRFPIVLRRVGSPKP